eukprot:13728933-Ditylum_brightwellii.AAC.1
MPPRTSHRSTFAARRAAPPREIHAARTLKSALVVSTCSRRHTASTKLATQDRKPARKELKGKLPTSS